MDPLSLCASILAIVTTAQTSAHGLRKLRQCWKAPRELDDLVLELESVQSTLRDVSSFVEKAGSTLYSESLSQPVLHASNTINNIQTLLSSSPAHFAHLSHASHARLTWLSHRNDIKALLDDLKVVRMDLSLKLGLVAAYVRVHPLRHL